MYYITFYMFLVIALLFTLLAIYFMIEENYVFAGIFQLLCIVVWFTLAAACVEIELPYTAIQSDDTIVNGVHIYGDSTAPAQMYFFSMMAVIMFILWTAYSLLPVVWKVLFKRDYHPFFGRK